MKELTGDSIHTRSELLELRAKIEKSRKASSWPEANRDSTVNLAAGRYQVRRLEIIRSTLQLGGIRYGN